MFPVGVVKNWRTKITVPPGTGSSLSKTSTKQGSSFPLGGLADDDVGARRPSPVGSTHSSGKNVSSSSSKSPYTTEIFKTIEILSDTDDETPMRPPPKAATKKSTPAAKKGAKPVRVKVQSSPSIDPATAEVIGLPEFARSGWTSVYLPTWYHFIGTRNDGWDFCPLGQEVKVIQSVLNKCYPGTTYEVKKGCPIYTTVMTTPSIVPLS